MGIGSIFFIFHHRQGNRVPCAHPQPCLRLHCFALHLEFRNIQEKKCFFVW